MSTTAQGLRPLGLPRPLRVRTDERGDPVELTLLPRGVQRPRGGEGRTLAIEQVEEVWRIAEEWWREATLARTYYRVVVDGGRSLTLFRDELIAGPDEGWYEQRY